MTQHARHRTPAQKIRASVSQKLKYRSTETDNHEPRFQERDLAGVEMHNWKVIVSFKSPGVSPITFQMRRLSTIETRILGYFVHSNPGKVTDTTTYKRPEESPITRTILDGKARSLIGARPIGKQEESTTIRLDAVFVTRARLYYDVRLSPKAAKEVMEISKEGEKGMEVAMFLLKRELLIQSPIPISAENECTDTWSLVGEVKQI